MNIDLKILKKKISKPNPTTHKMIIPQDQIGFVPGWQGYFNTHKSINMIYHINKKKRQKTQDHLNRFKKMISQTYDLIQHSFNIKIVTKVNINETSFNITKAIYEKFRVNIILSSEKLSLPSRL